MGRWLDSAIYWAWATTPITVFAVFCVNLTAAIKYWGPIMAHRNERLRDIQDQRAGDWERLRDRIKRLEDRCDHLQREVDECREREGEWIRRAMIAEGYQLGGGNYRQDITILESNERVKKDKEK